jgi:uncharacterized Ntn-hydrolase superfamily protein
MSYSIVARDPASGAIGVAVQSCFFGVGAVVPWARPGVGAVATQAFTDPAYGPRCLDALAAGVSAAEALDKASAADAAPFLRQVGVIARTAAWPPPPAPAASTMPGTSPVTTSRSRPT